MPRSVSIRRSVSGSRSTTTRLRALSFFRPAEDSPEAAYVRDRRSALGGSWPKRSVDCAPLDPPDLDLFKDQIKGSGDREQSTTMAFVRMLSKLLDHPTLGEFVVPIVPDEARTFGMEALFKKAGIYSSEGQKYQPVDDSTLHAVSGSHRRSDPAGRNLRDRCDGFVYGGRYGLRGPRRPDDSLLHFLLDLRLPTRRGHDLGMRRHALSRLLTRRNFRPHDAQWRRPSTRGRAFPNPREHGAEPAQLRPSLRLRARCHYPRRYSADVSGTGRDLLLHHDSQPE